MNWAPAFGRTTGIFSVKGGWRMLKMMLPIYITLHPFGYTVRIVIK